MGVWVDGWTRVELPTTSGNVGQLTGIMHVHLVCAYIYVKRVVMRRRLWWRDSGGGYEPVRHIFNGQKSTDVSFCVNGTRKPHLPQMARDQIPY